MTKTNQKINERRYYEINQDMSIQEPLVVHEFRRNKEIPPPLNPNDTIEFSSSHFCHGVEYKGSAPFYADVQHDGLPLAFSLYAGMPIILKEMAEALVGHGVNAQLLPIIIEGVVGDWVVMNLLDVLDCIDDDKTEEVTFWKEEDGVPELVGSLSNVVGLVVDPNRIPEKAKVFRIEDWVSIIVSEDAKDLIESWPDHGVVFEEVYPSIDRTLLQSMDTGSNGVDSSEENELPEDVVRLFPVKTQHGKDYSFYPENWRNGKLYQLPEGYVCHFTIAPGGYVIFSPRGDACTITRHPHGKPQICDPEGKNYPLLEEIKSEDDSGGLIKRGLSKLLGKDTEAND